MTFNDFFRKYKPSSPKWGAMLLGSSIWTFAAYRILLMSYKLFKQIESPKMLLIIGLVGFVVFFFSIFYRVTVKYINRMKSYEIERPCVFAFFNIKGYIIMSIMITMGILSSKISSIPINYKATFYMALGMSLLTSAILFLITAIQFFIQKK